MSDAYFPPKPNDPYLCPNDGHDPCFKPNNGKVHPGCECGPGPMPLPPYPPPPPPPPSPCYSWQPSPGLGQIPPVPSVLEGQSLYEAMNVLGNRVNVCIEQWNNISRNCFAAMNACVEAARANDVYYDDCEVKYFTGYDEVDGCAWSMVQKEAVDRNGQPIFVRLAPAYDNSTNSGIRQDIFDVSYIKSANVIMTAVPPQNDQWYFPAMWQGAPIPGEYPPGYPDPTYYVAGFNRAGALRYFANTATETDLCQNGMVDVIGPVVPMLSDGELTDQIKAYDKYSSVCAIGYAKGTGRVYFFTCSAQDNPGMAPISVARLLQGYGCTTAVATAIIPAENQNISAGMLYMGQMTAVPQGGKSPNNLAYWYISKQCSFRNKFQKEVADLVQTTGQNAWKNYLLGVQIQSFDDRITQNAKDLQDEIERATQAEQDLQTNINNEVIRATEAEKLLQENIDNEVNRATAAETALNEKIEAETARATQAETNLHQEILDETSRAKAAESANAAAIAAEKLRAQTRENEIQDALDSEVRARIAADNDIINAIEQEVLARRAADTELSNKIDAVKNELKIDITNLQNTINGITGGQTALPYLKLTGGTLTGNVTFSDGNTLTLGRGPTTDSEAATKKYVDDAVAAGGGGGTGGDVTKEYVDQQIAAVQGQVTGKVSKSGDTMTGALNMDGQKIENAVLSSNTGTSLDNGAGGAGTIVNVADPTASDQVANKNYVDSAIQTAVAPISPDNFVKKTGDNMTGDLGMMGANVQFGPSTAFRAYQVMDLDEDAEKPALTKTGRVSQLAKRLGVTQELVDAASKNGLDTATASIAQVYAAAAPTPAAIVDPEATIGLDAEGDIVVQSVNNGVRLKGSEVAITDGAGAAAPLYIGDVNLYVHNQGTQPEHLDINVPTDTGAVYINRSVNGQVQNGGTGELNVTTIKAPNELDLMPGTSVDVNGAAIKGLTTLRPNTNDTTIKIASKTTGSTANGTLDLLSINLNNLDGSRQGNITGVSGGVNINTSGTGYGVKINTSSSENITLSPGGNVSISNKKLIDVGNAGVNVGTDGINALMMSKWGIGGPYTASRGSEGFSSTLTNSNVFSSHIAFRGVKDTSSTQWGLYTQPPIENPTYILYDIKIYDFGNSYHILRDGSKTSNTIVTLKAEYGDGTIPLLHIGYNKDALITKYGMWANWEHMSTFAQFYAIMDITWFYR